jgi:hypothetical protein
MVEAAGTSCEREFCVTRMRRRGEIDSELDFRIAEGPLPASFEGSGGHPDGMEARDGMRGSSERTDKIFDR